MTATDGNAGMQARVLSRILLAPVVVLLLWRLLDFIDEVMGAGVKMSLGPFLLTGYPAAAVQLALIFLLLLVAGRVTMVLRSPTTR